MKSKEFALAKLNKQIEVYNKMIDSLEAIQTR